MQIILKLQLVSHEEEFWKSNLICIPMLLSLPFSLSLILPYFSTSNFKENLAEHYYFLFFIVINILLVPSILCFLPQIVQNQITMPLLSYRLEFTSRAILGLGRHLSSRFFKSIKLR